MLSAPTGAGKTTIARRLIEREPDFVFSVSATTRAPRAGEQQGVDYEFVNEPTFREMIERGELAEWARVHDRWYGTPIRNLSEAAERGQFALLDIDVQGASQIRHRIPDAILVFIMPPSLDVWIDRLRARGTEDADEVQRRLRSALDELACIDEFDFVVVNADLEASVDQVGEIARGQVNGRGPVGVQERVAALRAGVAALLDAPD